MATADNGGANDTDAMTAQAGGVSAAILFTVSQSHAASESKAGSEGPPTAVVGQTAVLDTYRMSSQIAKNRESEEESCCMHAYIQHVHKSSHRYFICMQH